MGAEVPPVIQLQQATVRRGGATLWREVNLKIQPGEFVAVLGPNGVGKSTLLKVILGLIPLSQGSVQVLGSPARVGHPGIGYLPQRCTFPPDLPIRGQDLVGLSLEGNRWGVPIPFIRRLWCRGGQLKREQAWVREAIERVGAGAYASRRVGELSGGEQQRLLMAQALVTKPQILLLDEPFDSLDLANQQAMVALVRELSTASQITVLLVVHDLNPVLPYLDRVLYLAQGQALLGSPQEVITSETLSRLYGAPIDVLRTRDGRVVVVGQPDAYSSSSR